MKLSTLLIGSAAFVAAFGALEAEARPKPGHPNYHKPSTNFYIPPGTRPSDDWKKWVGSTHGRGPGGVPRRPGWNFDVMDEPCTPFLHVVCPRGSSKRFVKNSVEPGCAPIPVCFRYKPTNLDQMDDEMEDEMEDDEFVGGKCGIRGGCRL